MVYGVILQILLLLPHRRLVLYYLEKTGTPAEHQQLLLEVWRAADAFRSARAENERLMQGGHVLAMVQEVLPSIYSGRLMDVTRHCIEAGVPPKVAIYFAQ